MMNSGSRLLGMELIQAFRVNDERKATFNPSRGHVRKSVYPSEVTHTSLQTIARAHVQLTMRYFDRG